MNCIVLYVYSEVYCHSQSPNLFFLVLLLYCCFIRIAQFDSKWKKKMLNCLSGRSWLKLMWTIILLVYISNHIRNKREILGNVNAKIEFQIQDQRHNHTVFKLNLIDFHLKWFWLVVTFCYFICSFFLRNSTAAFRFTFESSSISVNL